MASPDSKPDFPPRLVGFVEEPKGLVLHLSDGVALGVQVSSQRLSALLGAPLGALAASASVDVYYPRDFMDAPTWRLVRALLPMERFANHPALLRLLALDVDELKRRPCRVYCGTDHGRTLFLSYPVHFSYRPHEARHYGLLNDGDLLWKVWVDLRTESVEIQSGSIPGHFVGED